MMDAAPLLARVQMPEQGIFAVRCPDAGVSKGQEVVVNLGYGPDIGTVLGFEAYDPAVHGASVPGYQLVRAKTDDDARTVAANADAAQKLQAELLEAARSLSPDVRILHMRLSLGRQRLFVWYACPSRRCDLAPLAKELGQRLNANVFVRLLGPRDLVGQVGALGPCGRPCCCATWQTRYPSNLTPELVRACGSTQPNGICGRFKCCLAFEE